MPTSVYIFLIVCVISFLPAYWDHGKTLGEVKKAKGRTRVKKIAKLLLLWLIPVLTLIGTVTLGIEGMNDRTEQQKRQSEYKDVTNQLKQGEIKYERATNAQAIAERAARQATNAANSLNAAALENLPRRLTLDQQNKLLQAIEPLPKWTFTFILDDSVKDGREFAGTLGFPFVRAGWNLLPLNRAIVTALDDKISVSGNEGNGATLKTVADTLTSLGFPTIARTNKALYMFGAPTKRISNVVTIIIGYKPHQ